MQDVHSLRRATAYLNLPDRCSWPMPGSVDMDDESSLKQNESLIMWHFESGLKWRCQVISTHLNLSHVCIQG